MSKSGATRPSSDPGARTWSCPGKFFLLGEYAVLDGGPALLAAAGPRFRLTAAGTDEQGHPFAPESPAARLLEGADRKLSLRFEDSHGGKGGFGGSVAEFLLAHAALLATGADVPGDWRGLRRLYRSLAADRGVPPSGADLVCQALGGWILFDPAKETADVIRPGAGPERFVVLSAAGIAGRKVRTHEHLASLGERRFPAALSEGVLSGAAALREGDAAVLGAELTRYGEMLASLGLEIPGVRREVADLTALPGVLGAKGLGALQADGLVAVTADAAAAARAEELGRSLGMVPLDREEFGCEGIREDEGGPR